MEDEADFFPQNEGEAENWENGGNFAAAVQGMEDELALFSQLVLQLQFLNSPPFGTNITHVH